ncbi:unnamed protein product, partial [Urochloa humidicola]
PIPSPSRVDQIDLLPFVFPTNKAKEAAIHSFLSLLQIQVGAQTRGGSDQETGTFTSSSTPYQRASPSSPRRPPAAARPGLPLRGRQQRRSRRLLTMVKRSWRGGDQEQLRRAHAGQRRLAAALSADSGSSRIASAPPPALLAPTWRARARQPLRPRSPAWRSGRREREIDWREGRGEGTGARLLLLLRHVSSSFLRPASFSSPTSGGSIDGGGRGEARRRPHPAQTGA